MGSRRGQRWFAAIGVGLALTVAAALTGAPASAQEEPPPGTIPEGDWTQGQIDWMLGWIDRTETQLPERFPTSYSDGGAQLEAMGYHNFGATAPGGYDHWINNQWVVDGHFLNPMYAESLLYRNVGGGVWELQAAMYMLPPDWGMDEIPGLISWLPGWHGHPELCVTDDGGTFGGITDPENPSCPPGTHQGTTPIMTHVWLFDPGCGHRFGGVGVDGLHCDFHHDMS
jgi:hypothetical protein